MKTLLTLSLAAVLLTGCTYQRLTPIEKTKYMTIVMLQDEYHLTKDQVKAIKRAYFRGEIDCSYNAGIGEVLYPAGDYSKY